MSGSGGKYDTSKEDEVKKVNYSIYFPFECILLCKFNFDLKIISKSYCTSFFNVPVFQFLNRYKPSWKPRWYEKIWFTSKLHTVSCQTLTHLKTCWNSKRFLSSARKFWHILLTLIEVLSSHLHRDSDYESPLYM